MTLSIVTAGIPSSGMPGNDRGGQTSGAMPVLFPHRFASMTSPDSKWYVIEKYDNTWCWPWSTRQPSRRLLA